MIDREDNTSKTTSPHTEAPAATPKETPAGNVQATPRPPRRRVIVHEEAPQQPLSGPAVAPECATPAGIAATWERQRTISGARNVLQKAFLFPDERLRPMSYQIPVSFGPPTARYTGVCRGIPYESLHFQSADPVKRALRPVHGYDE